MADRTWALAAGGIVLVGAAVAGGYLVGHKGGQQTQVAAQPQTSAPAQQAPASSPDASQPGTSQTASSEPSPAPSSMPSGYYPSSYSSRGHHRIGFGDFHDELSHYGHWAHSDRWGECGSRMLAPIIIPTRADIGSTRAN